MASGFLKYPSAAVSDWKYSLAPENYDRVRVRVSKPRNGGNAFFDFCIKDATGADFKLIVRGAPTTAVAIDNSGPGFLSAYNNPAHDLGRNATKTGPTARTYSLLYKEGQFDPEVADLLPPETMTATAADQLAFFNYLQMFERHLFENVLWYCEEYLPERGRKVFLGKARKMHKGAKETDDKVVATARRLFWQSRKTTIIPTGQSPSDADKINAFNEALCDRDTLDEDTEKLWAANAEGKDARTMNLFADADAESGEEPYVRRIKMARQAWYLQKVNGARKQDADPHAPDPLEPGEICQAYTARNYVRWPLRIQRMTRSGKTEEVKLPDDPTERVVHAGSIMLPTFELKPWYIAADNYGIKVRVADSQILMAQKQPRAADRGTEMPEYAGFAAAVEDSQAAKRARPDDEAAGGAEKRARTSDSESGDSDYGPSD